MDTVTGYNSNRISSSVFYRKPVNSMEMKLVSKEPIFSLHTGNVSLSKEHRFIGLAAALKLDKNPKLDKSVNEITQSNPVKDSQTSESGEVKREEPEDLTNPVKQIIEIKPVYPLIRAKETLDSDIDDNDDESNESKPDDESKPVDQITETNSISPVKEYEESNEYDIEENKPNCLSKPVDQITEIKPVPILHPVEKFQNCKISDITGKQEDELEENKPDNLNKPVNQITEIEPVPPPPVNKSQNSDSENEEAEISDQTDNLEDDVNEIKPEESHESVNQITEIKPVLIFPRNSKIEEVKDRISDSSSYSFELPILHNEDECVKRKQLTLPKTQTQTRPKSRFCHNSEIHEIRPRRKQTSQTRSLIAYWFSCFYCPYQRDRTNRQIV